MFKLPSIKPNLSSKYEDWADYAEYLAINKGQVALADIIKPSLMSSDEIEINGADDDSDKLNFKVDEISGEINRRIKVTKGNYPFELINSDYTLKHQVTEDNYFHIYSFLLYATRLNMSTEKLQSGYDGTQLFEKLSALIALNFFGENTQGDVFGTSKTDVKGFRAKLTEVVKSMKEGGYIHKRPGLSPQDDKIDIIVWKGFTDKKTSQLIAFGQCKTGTSWKDKLSELDPQTFCNTWFTSQPVTVPIKMFFSSQYFHAEIWDGKAYSAGLIFDRFRILDYLPNNISADLMEKIKLWNLSAQKLYSS